MSKEIKKITINDIKSDTFSNKKEFNDCYKKVKNDFKNQLGFDFMKQGLITLYMCMEDKNIPMTSNSKMDMLEYMSKYKSYDFFLFIKGNTYIVK